ncbi:hypothetical protein G5I_09612 [Acromyrmex echinatior]|uniref:Circadian clock-controlled protein n=1 Tax=Acromyrmex echinatior TaxID=103372 RepID=F4WUN5_ACREC|nr:hypothetical protein G5I_09612 [Acromyrmex echinatior]
MDNINNVRDEICKRSPELKFLQLEPFIIDKIVFFDEPSIKLYFENIKCYIFCEFVINSVHTDFDKLQFNFDIAYNINMTSSYNLDAHLLVPIVDKGKIQILSNNVKLQERLELNVITQNSKKHIYASKANTNIDVKDFDYKFDESEIKLVQLNEIINYVVNDNKQKVFDKIIPVFEKKFSEIFIQLFNFITQSNYEEFFPEEI